MESTKNIAFVNKIYNTNNYTDCEETFFERVAKGLRYVELYR